jgi:hypothetical protein
MGSLPERRVDVPALPVAEYVRQLEMFHVREDAMTPKELDNERKGNEGRKQWNARPQPADEAQQMLAGAIRTIDRLLAVLANDR